MGPRASRNCVTSVPLGHRRWTSRRVSSGMGSKPWDFSDIGHLVSCSNRGGHLPPTGYALSLSLPHLTCSLVWTEFPNRVINRHLRVYRHRLRDPCYFVKVHKDSVREVLRLHNQPPVVIGITDAKPLAPSVISDLTGRLDARCF